MIWLIIIAYLTPASAVYRRAGYVWNDWLLRTGHQFSDICKELGIEL